MLRPERMTSASIICVNKDVEPVLEALNKFGEFHIDQAAHEETDLTAYNSNIQRVEESLSDVNLLIKQLAQEKTGFLSIFKVIQPTRIKVTAENWQELLESTSQKISAVKKENGNLNAELTSLREQTAEFNHQKSMLTTMESMGIDLAAIDELKLITVSVASIPAKNFIGLQTSLSGIPTYIYHCSFAKEDIIYVSVATPKKHQADVERILKTYHSEIFTIPANLPRDVSLALKEVNSKLKENNEKEKTLTEALKKLCEENRGNFFSWRETEENILTLLNAEKKILQSGRLTVVKGFVPQKRFQELDKEVNGMLEGKVLVLENEATIETEHSLNLPTKISNSKFFKPFEEITKLYGIPIYSEIDPTPFIAITFPILFGLMFGDLGHGLVLLIGGAAVGKLLKGNQGIRNVGWIMSACGFASCITGLLFGESFGIALPWGPLWFSPFHDVLSFLIFSLVVGIVQIVSGIVIEIVNLVYKHKIVDAILTASPKIAFYLGGVYLIATYQLDFAAWLAGPILLPVIPFFIMVAGKPIYQKLVKPKNQKTSEHDEQDSLVVRFFEGGDFFTRLLGNTISYSRILALLMAHWALLLVVYTVSELAVEAVGAGSILAAVLSGVVIIFGNIFVLALEGLIVFIHTLRLHFYEWFSKFYQGTGIEFSPFKQNFVYTEVELKGKKD